MPAIVKRALGSFSGTKEAEEITAWPFSAKKRR
jgi:hypothetical protein